MSLLRRRVRVVNRSRYPDEEVVRIVERAMTGSRRHPPLVVVRNLASGSRQVGFTPFDRHRPIELWVDAPNRYPAAGAASWDEDLALSAAHEDFHFHTPALPCPDGSCEVLAEGYARQSPLRRAPWRS